MKSFKLIDIVISCLLITLFFILTFARISSIFTAYFVVGGWQLISMATHFAMRWFMNRGGTRSVYHWTVCVIIVICLLCFVTPVCFFIFYVLLIASPLMAIGYTSICVEEYRQLKARELVHLK